MEQTVGQWVESTMPVITAIETQKNHAERVNVYLDGRFAFGASALVIAAHRLKKGSELSDEDIESLKDDDSAEKAYNAALNYLSFRPRSTRELEDYFRRKGVEPATAEAVIERLRRINLINDDEFARFWVENRQSFRPRGARALRMELRQKGLSGDTIEEALEQLGDEDEIAANAGRKKMGSYRNLDERTFVTRMIGFLQRRGFSYGVAAKAARDLLAERGGEIIEEDLEPLTEDIPSD
jgi:regulatory protein